MKYTILLNIDNTLTKASHLFGPSQKPNNRHRLINDAGRWSLDTSVVSQKLLKKSTAVDSKGGMAVSFSSATQKDARTCKPYLPELAPPFTNSSFSSPGGMEESP
jgi:hypothetical protein